MKFTPNTNTPVANFSLAVNRAFARQGEERKADFFNVIVWGKQAEFCSKYFSKGRQIVVEGRIENRTWDDQEGKRHYITEIIAENLHFADSKPSDGSQSGQGGYPNQGYSNGGYSAPAAKPQANPASPVQSQQSSDGFYALDEDDDLPF